MMEAKAEAEVEAGGPQSKSNFVRTAVTVEVPVGVAGLNNNLP